MPKQNKNLSMEEILRRIRDKRDLSRDLLYAELDAIRASFFRPETGMEMPVLLAERVAYTWKVWCPFCMRYHNHSQGEGHRVAHCSSGPLKHNGYHIMLAKRTERMTEVAAKKLRSKE